MKNKPKSSTYMRLTIEPIPDFRHIAKTWVKQRDVNLTNLASITGFSRQTLSKWLGGNVDYNMGVDTVDLIFREMRKYDNAKAKKKRSRRSR
jgi:hypothetical protein